MFGGKKAKELEEELLALQEKQNRLQEQISNIAKAMIPARLSCTCGR